MLISGLVTNSIFLISRVMVGQCPPDTTLFLQQACNQQASSGGIPSELVYGGYLLPMLTQLCFRNIGIRTLVFCNFFGFITVAFCIIYGNLWNDYFCLVAWVFFSNASFEIERLQRVGYAQTVKILDQKELEMEQLKHERTMQEALTAQKMKLDRAEDEKRLKEAEAVQLRSLIGNVAHDLKTPLFTIEADLETLKMIVEAIP
jgi:signal transduction histidine kinase